MEENEGEENDMVHLVCLVLYQVCGGVKLSFYIGNGSISDEGDKKYVNNTK